MTYSGRVIFSDQACARHVRELLESLSLLTGAKCSRWTIHANHAEAVVSIETTVSLGDFVANLKFLSAPVIAEATGFPVQRTWAPGYEAKALSSKAND